MRWTGADENDEQQFTRESEDMTAMVYAWPDIEQRLLDDPKLEDLADAVRRAFRVEAIREFGLVGHNKYRISYNVADAAARRVASKVERDYELGHTIRELTPGVYTEHAVRLVYERKPVVGEVCPRVMASVPQVPDLEELPTPEPEGSTVPLVERDHYWLTPIEEPFYDALRATELTFAVQPWVQQHDRRNIAPGTERHFDLVHVEKWHTQQPGGKPQIVVDVWPIPADIRHHVYARDFEIDLVVTAHNADPRRSTATVSWDGEWPDDELELWEHFRVVLPHRR